MTLNSAGRPPKMPREKRQQLQFSLYAEDVARLEQLTDNRSEFIRECIAQAWAEKTNRDDTITLALPKRLLRELLTVLQHQVPPNRAAVVQGLVEELLENEE
jgi:metal-responsive CopG/Arc/MetJ family transcriptional regulator